MTQGLFPALRLATASLLLFLRAAFAAVQPVGAANDPLEDVLSRASKQVSSYLDLISEVNCTERVTQEKIADNGKVVQKQETVFDYLILLTNAGSELDLAESRIAADEGKQRKKPRSPLLVSNGFSTLFLVFHPYYASGFQFTLAGQETIAARTLTKVHFQHVPGMPSPAALAVRGREYPLDLSGTAWIDKESGVIARIEAGVDSGMEDVGLRTLRSEVEYAPIVFGSSREAFWLPSQTVVEVQSRHQHWRNTHRFSDYKRFSVKTKEQIANQ